jgi:Domain of unknown function (DUF4145)
MRSLIRERDWAKTHSMARKKTIGAVETILCRTCKVRTKHTIRGVYENDDDDAERGLWWKAIHDILSCNGCNTVTYRITTWSSEDPEPGEILYPKRGETKRERAPKDFANLPYGGPFESLYRQTIAAFNSELLTLSAAGVRLLVEGLCRDKGVRSGTVIDSNTGKPRTSKNLDGKINGLAETGHITMQQALALHEIRFLGNDAAHELYQPTRVAVEIAIELIEQIVTQIYDQPEQTARLAKRKRPAK